MKIFLQKVGALIIDYLVLVVTTFVMVNFISPFFIGIYGAIIESSGKTFAKELVMFYIGQLSIGIMVIITFFYYGHTFKKAGQTIGEKIMKIKIVPAYGERISLLTAILRTIFLAPLLALIGLIPVSRSPYKSLLDHITLTKTEKADPKRTPFANNSEVFY